MKKNETEATRKLLLSEGGYTNHPNDPGGPTNFGITIADARKHIWPGQNVTVTMMRGMTKEQALKVYDAKYWDRMLCDDLPSGLDYAIYDYGVNSGTGRSGRVLRALLRMPVGTNIDRSVIEKINSLSPSRRRALIAQLCDERLAFLKRLHTWPVFGVGWGRRVAAVRRDSLAMFDRDQRGEASIEVAQSAKAYTAPVNRYTQEDEEQDQIQDLEEGVVDEATDLPPQISTLTKKEAATTGAAGAGAGAFTLSDVTEAANKAVEAKGNADQLGVTDVLTQLVHFPTFWIGSCAIVAIAGYLGYRWYRTRS